MEVGRDEQDADRAGGGAGHGAWGDSGEAPIIGVTKVGYIDGLVRAHGIELADEEIAELEALADAADVDTRGWWEHEM